MKKSELAAGKIGRPRRPERSVSAGIRKETAEALGRTPRSTTIYGFYNGADGSRNPGQWPSLLRRAWQPRANEATEPMPYAPDNIENRGSRASQYSS